MARRDTVADLTEDAARVTDVPMIADEPSILGARPLRLQIADHLREAILSGRLLPGEPLTEAWVANLFNVSRAPIREAMRTLAETGLIETIPYKGTYVRRLDARDIEELYSLRLSLENFAIRRVIEAGADVSPLAAVMAELIAAATGGDPRALNAADQRFHHTIVVLADHSLLLNVWASLAMRTRQIITLRNQRNRNLMEVALNHAPLLDALRRGDLPAALELIDRHVRSAADLARP